MAIPIYSQSNPNEEKHQRFLFHQKQAKENNLNLEYNGLQALKNAQSAYCGACSIFNGSTKRF